MTENVSYRKVLRWMISTAVICALLCMFAPMGLRAAYGADAFKIDDTSYSTETYIGQARSQNAQNIWVSTSQSDVKNVVIDWKVDSFEGYRKTMFETGPYLATIGKAGNAGQVTFKTGAPIAVKSLKFYTDDPVIVEEGTTANFDGCTFKYAPVIRGIANFNNCVFEDKTVKFEGGQATYTGSTEKPTEVGKKSEEHVPLVLKVMPTTVTAVHEHALHSTHTVELEGSQKDRAVVTVEPQGDPLGIDAVYRSGRVELSGTPTQPGTATFVVKAAASAPAEEQTQKIVVTVEPQVTLEVPDNLFVATKYTKKYQQSRKPMIKVGDAEPKELLTYMQEDDTSMPLPEVVTPEGLPSGFTGRWLYDSVVVAGNEPQPKGVYPIKVRIRTKGQVVESNVMHLRIYDGDESLRQQLDEVYTQELGSPEKWEMQPYFINTSDHAVIPTSLKVLMGSDCHNRECEDGNCDARPITDDDTCPAPVMTDAGEAIVLDSMPSGESEAYESDADSVPDITFIDAGTHPWDAIAMSTSGGDSGTDGSTGGAGESGSCWLGVVGTGSKETYDTDTLTIPSGANVTFLNMKIKSSVRIIVEQGAHLTFDDTTTFGVIEVKQGGTFSAKNGSISNNSIIFRDGSIMDGCNIKSNFNSLSDGYDDRDAPEALVIVEGNVRAVGTSRIVDGLVSRKEKDKDRESFPALLLRDNAVLTIDARSIVTAQGGDATPYVREGGDGVLMGHNAIIDGEGKLEAMGGKGYEDHGGLAVRGPQTEPRAVLKPAVLLLKGGDGKTVIGVDSPGNYGSSGHVEIVKGCKTTVEGGTGTKADRTEGETKPAFDPAFPDPTGYGAAPTPNPDPAPIPNPDPTPDPAPTPDPDPAPNPQPHPQPTPVEPNPGVVVPAPNPPYVSDTTAVIHPVKPVDNIRGKAIPDTADNTVQHLLLALVGCGVLFAGYWGVQKNYRNE